MEEKISWEEAEEAKKILFKYLEQQLYVECTNLNERKYEVLLYLALKLDMCLF